MYLTYFQSLQWLIANSVIIMADKEPFAVEAWAPWKIRGGHSPPPRKWRLCLPTPLTIKYCSCAPGFHPQHIQLILDLLLKIYPH